MKLEVIVLPVSDVDRAKEFYASLGWRLDADVAAGDDFRLIQFTPPGSECSVQFGTGLTAAAPGSAQVRYLIVSDIEVARDQLVARGVEVSEVFHEGKRGARFQLPGTNGRVSGPAPDRSSYGSFASFSDPDGNGWLFQEVTTRLPGRVDSGPASCSAANGLAGAVRGPRQIVRRREGRRSRVDTAGQPRGDLLEQPAVAVRVAERGEGAVARAIGRRAADATVRAGELEPSASLPFVEHLADLDTARHQLVAGYLDIGDDQVPNLSRTGRGRRESRAELDRALGARRRELDQAEVVTGGDVGVEPPPEARVELLRAVDVRDGQHHNLEFHIHLNRSAQKAAQLWASGSSARAAGRSESCTRITRGPSGRNPSSAESV